MAYILCQKLNFLWEKSWILWYSTLDDFIPTMFKLPCLFLLKSTLCWMKLGLRRIKGPTLSVVLEISKMTPYNYQQIMWRSCVTVYQKKKAMVKVQYAVRSVGNAGSFPQISPLINFLSELLRNHRTQIYVYCQKI